MKKLKTILSKFIIFTIFLTITSILVWQMLPIYSNNSRYISAMKDLEKANLIAKDWRQNATLIVVHSADEVTSEGLAKKWRYSYAEAFSIKNSTKGYDVILSSDDSYTTYERKYPPGKSPLFNWTIDSREAVKIAKKNSIINSYLSTYKNAIIESMALGANQTFCGWTIEWNDPGFMDDPHSAKISIDANTGMVLYIWMN
jgi:hypothetical protein